MTSLFKRWMLPLVAILLASSCGVLGDLMRLDFVDLPETRAANLEALHQSSGKHRYAVKMMGDFQYASSLRGRRVAGVHIGKPSSRGPGEAREEVLRNPSETCLELLNELVAFDASDRPRLRSIQVSWCARLIAEDPSVLTRERAAIALGEFGVGLGIRGPRVLGLTEPRADADTVAAQLSSLIAAFRHARDGTGGAPGAASLKEAREVIEAETYDLDGARRVLYACASLLQGAGKGRPETEAMTELVRTMQRNTIELALGRGVLDPEGLVRGAAAAACVQSGDELVFAGMMSILKEETDSIALYRFLAVLLERGLPKPAEGLTAREYEAARESWLNGILTIAVQNSEDHLRARAMQVLGKVTEGGPQSLREEDWEAWWFARYEEEDERAAAEEARDGSAAP